MSVIKLVWNKTSSSKRLSFTSISWKKGGDFVFNLEIAKRERGETFCVPCSTSSWLASVRIFFFFNIINNQVHTHTHTPSQTDVSKSEQTSNRQCQQVEESVWTNTERVPWSREASMTRKNAVANIEGNLVKLTKCRVSTIISYIPTIKKRNVNKIRGWLFCWM